MIITVFNQKGGVGKTTLAANIATALHLEGKSVLLVDADKQGSSVEYHETRSNKDISTFATFQLISKTLHKDLHKYEFDHIIVDAGGRDSVVSRSAVLAADFVLLPFKPSALDLWSTEQIFDFLEEVKITKPLKVAGVLNMYPARTKLANQIDETLAELTKEYDVKFFKQKIGNRLAYSYSIMEGVSILEYEDKKASAEFQSFMDELTDFINE